MERKNLFGILTCVALLCGSGAWANEYQPGEVFRLDLSQAVLSPRPLGPEAHFEPVPIEARTDRASMAADRDRADVTRTVATVRHRHVVRSAERPRTAARSRLANRKNLLDAQAMDTRVQTWPCRPGNGGICSWR
ncbi:hypothetical protein [Bradyrhizobium sp. HKCCYLS20291]|uniref:hypothetical protein n=1 Tax=Bradyrhizobium sp. HKCCYLS20291 TaxID=3420766 RepID=UPI003EBD26BE